MLNFRHLEQSLEYQTILIFTVVLTAADDTFQRSFIRLINQSWHHYHRNRSSSWLDMPE